MNAATEQFERYLRRRYSDRSTPKHYLSDLRIFAHYTGHKSPTEVKVQDIDSFVDHQVEQGLSPATINRRLSTLHTFFEFLASEDPDRPWPNPVIWRRHKVKQGEHLPRDVPEIVVERLFAAIDSDRDRAMFGLMIGAGLRVGEVADLRLQCLEEPSSPEQMARLRVEGKGRKERIVWLTLPLYNTVQTWLQQRPDSDSDHFFLNQHARPLSEAGIQYLLKQHAERAGVQLTCHQLRHTFGRRMTEQEMPIESLAKLLGHAQVQTTQIYTSGADPKLRQTFAQAMAQLAETCPPSSNSSDVPSDFLVTSSRQREQADPADLEACFTIFDSLPTWVQEPLQTYLTRRWRNWQPHMARRNGRHVAHRLRSIWQWLFDHYSLSSWSDLQRSQLEAWLDACQEAGNAASTRSAKLSIFLSFLRFIMDQDIFLNANLFRTTIPELPEALPRHLSESEYQRLEQTVFAQTAQETPTDTRERAWFLTLAYTGLRISELLNLRLADLDLAGDRLIVRGGKNMRDRVAYLTPILTRALQNYLSHRKPAATDHLWLNDEQPTQEHHVRQSLHHWGHLSDVKVTPHCLRHTFATRLINQGVSLVSLQKLMGHKHLHSTQRYARVYDATVQEQFQQAMANLEGIAVHNWPQSTIAVETVEQPVV
jgi:site-specific recombinase XerD